MQHALELNPQSSEAHVCGAWVLRERGDLALAADAARAALDADPNAAEAHHVLAVVLWGQGDTRTAEAAFKEAIALRNGNDTLHLSNYARMLVTLERAADALPLARQVLALTPSHAAAHALYGRVLRHMERDAEAAMAYTEALRLDPLHAAAHDGLGVIELARGNSATAGEHFSTALRLQPNNASAHEHLAAALKARNRIYGTLLCLSLRYQRHSVQHGLKQALYLFLLVLVILGCLSEVFPILKTGGIPFLVFGLYSFLLVVLAGFIWSRVIDPLFNTLLLLDPIGRHAVTYDVADSIAVATAAVALISLVVAILCSMLNIAPLAVSLGSGFVLVSCMALFLIPGLRHMFGVERFGVYISYGVLLLGGGMLVVGYAIDHTTYIVVGMGLLLFGLLPYIFVKMVCQLKDAAARWRRQLRK